MDFFGENHTDCKYLEMIRDIPVKLVSAALRLKLTFKTRNASFSVFHAISSKKEKKTTNTAYK
jgi:hypothetical protein